MRKYWQVAALATGVTIPLLYVIDMRRAYKRLEEYEATSFQSEFGKMSYVDEGQGEAILISHGIYGGYDQGIISLKGLVGENFRKIAVSRFGYPGSKLPLNPTPQNQAQVFVELLDRLNIEKTFIIAISSGSASALAFALTFPERTKGLILLSADAPLNKITTDHLKPVAPPIPLLTEFPLWASTKVLRPAFSLLYGSDMDKRIVQTMLPIKLRRKGIEADVTITNVDMDLNYDNYPVENITAPILVIHAKDDPIALFECTEKLIERVQPETVIFENGGHLLSEHQAEAAAAALKFIHKNV